MKGFFSFLKTKVFLKHFSFAFLSLVIVVYGLFKLLDVYTDHGETVPVPDFQGQKISALQNFAEGKGIQYEIVDSIYDPTQKRGVVVKQDPAPETRVKHNRTIYLYVTSVMPPQIEMPKLIDRSLRAALTIIESYGLKAKTKSIPGDCDGCILKQEVNGKTYTSEDFSSAAKSKSKLMIKKGTTIILYVGEGESETRVPIPDLKCVTLREALLRLGGKGLSAGLIAADERSKDSLSMFVYKQFPEASEEGTIKVGASVDLYITKDQTKANCK